jgi:glycosyltransferase involved in cell wall biosynthesis
MKVHFPLMGFSLSGGMRAIIEVANGLARRGYEVRITVPAYRANPPFPIDPRVDLRVLGKLSDSRGKYTLSLSSEAAKWGDVLVATNFKTPYVLRRSVRKNNSPAKILYFIQAYEPYTQGTLFEGPWWRKEFNRQTALKSYQLADRRCYVAHVIAGNIGKDSDPAIVRPGVDTKLFCPGDKHRDSKIRVGVISREGRLKGFQVFREAWNRLSDLHDKMRMVLLCVGPTPERIPSDAEILRSTSDREVAAFYRSLDIFVMPSLYEGCPYPPLEAMACGVAVLSSAAGGVVEYATHGENSLVVPTGDAPGMAEALRQLVESRELRERLAAAGHRTAQGFTWENTVDQFETVLKAL